MGGFFGGLAAGLGGAAPAIQQYAQQMRPILEQRKNDVIGFLQTRADRELDPSIRGDWDALIAKAKAGNMRLGDVLTQGDKLWEQGRKNSQQINDAVARHLPGLAQEAGVKLNQGATIPAPAGPGQVAGTTTQPAPDSGFAGLLSPPPDAVGAESSNPIQAIAGAASQPAPLPAAQTSATAVPVTEGQIKTAPTSPVQGALANASEPVNTSAPAAAIPVPGAAQAPVSEYQQYMQGLSPNQQRYLDLEDKWLGMGIAPPASVTAYNAPVRAKLADLKEKEAYQNYQLQRARQIMGGDLSGPMTQDKIIALQIAGIPGLGSLASAAFNPQIIRGLSAGDVRRQHPELASQLPEGTADNAPVDLVANKLDMAHPSRVYVASEANRLLGYDEKQQPIFGLSRSLPAGSAIPGVYNANAVNSRTVGYDNTGHIELSSPYNIAHHIAPLTEPGTAAFMFPRYNTGLHPIQTTDPVTGNPVTQLVSETSVSGHRPLAPTGNWLVDGGLPAPAPRATTSAPAGGVSSAPKNGSGGIFQKPGTMTDEEVKANAADLLSGRMSPSQLRQQTGFGTIGTVNRNKILKEVRDENPNWNMEQAESNYAFGHSAAFQTTTRFMQSIDQSIDNTLTNAQKLANTNFTSFNKLRNAFGNEFQNIDLARFNADRLEVADQIAKILSGGTGSTTSDAKLAAAGALLKESDSPQKIAATLGEIRGLIRNRINAYAKGTYLENPSSGSGARPIPRPGADTKGTVNDLIREYGGKK